MVVQSAQPAPLSVLSLLPLGAATTASGVVSHWGDEAMRKIFLVILLLGATLLGGCATSGGGAGGSGGTSDSDITAAVKDAFKQDEVLSSANIDVNTEKGVVTLSGAVPNAMAYTRAISLARRVPGVKPPVQASGLIYSR